MKNKKIIILLFAFFVLSGFAYAQNLPIGLQRLIQYRISLAQSITFFLAFFAGVISFTSPCGIAFLPTFFSFAFKDRKKTMVMAVSFSAGMVIAFAIFGMIAGLLGDFFNQYKLFFAQVSGWMLVLLSILLFLNLEAGFLNFKVDYSNMKSKFSAFLIGFLFGVGFTPCAGPILIGILTLSANSSTLLSGVLMLVFYGLGIALPLIVLSYFSDKYDWANSRIFRGKLIKFKLFGKQIVTHTYNIIGSLLLMAIGILMIVYQGTFFFQTDLPRYIPWSMGLWDYMNELAVESQFLTSFAGNILGIALVAVIVLLVYINLKGKTKKNKNE